MTADERINALLERAGCPVMVVKSDAPPTPERHMADLIDRLEVALENALNERDHMLNTLRDAIYKDAVEHGLWDWAEASTDVNDLRSRCALLVWGEALELDEAYKHEKKYSEELADVIIMALSVAGKLGIDIDAAVRRKMEINKGRSFRHEGEK